MDELKLLLRELVLLTLLLVDDEDELVLGLELLTDVKLVDDREDDTDELGELLDRVDELRVLELEDDELDEFPATTELELELVDWLLSDRLLTSELLELARSELLELLLVDELLDVNIDWLLGLVEVDGLDELLLLAPAELLEVDIVLEELVFGLDDEELLDELLSVGLDELLLTSRSDELLLCELDELVFGLELVDELLVRVELLPLEMLVDELVGSVREDELDELLENPSSIALNRPLFFQTFDFAMAVDPCHGLGPLISLVAGRRAWTAARRTSSLIGLAHHSQGHQFDALLLLLVSHGRELEDVLAILVLGDIHVRGCHGPFLQNQLIVVGAGRFNPEQQVFGVVPAMLT